MKIDNTHQILKLFLIFKWQISLTWKYNIKDIPQDILSPPWDIPWALKKRREREK